MSHSIPSKGWYVLADARLHWSIAEGLKGPRDRDGFVRADLSIADGRIKALAVRDARPLPPRAVDLAGRIILPAFVDCHTHLDKGHIWQRMPNPDGTFAGALTATEVDRMAFWTATDVRRRIDFGLRCAYAYGTRAIRTHLDSIAPQDSISWDVLEELRSEWADRIELQAASLVGIEILRDRKLAAALADRVARAKGVFGAVTYMTHDLPELLDATFADAAQRGLDLDFHADETGDANAVSLRLIAEAALRNRFAGKILVGHCCSLARQPDQQVMNTLDVVARAGLSVVSLPLCNLYLQDRRLDRTTPRWRGVTLVHEMKARGIPVSVASDNTRDPFYAYGDLDMLEVFRMATRILHLDHPVDDWPRSVTASPAAAIGLERPGSIRAGDPADLVIFRGRSWTELLSRPESDRIVIRDGRAIARAVPDYSELDDLAGAAP
jgi:cytosine deaminase